METRAFFPSDPEDAHIKIERFRMRRSFRKTFRLENMAKAFFNIGETGVHHERVDTKYVSIHRDGLDKYYGQYVPAKRGSG